MSGIQLSHMKPHMSHTKWSKLQKNRRKSSHSGEDAGSLLCTVISSLLLLCFFLNSVILLSFPTGASRQKKITLLFGVMLYIGLPLLQMSPFSSTTCREPQASTSMLPFCLSKIAALPSHQAAALCSRSTWNDSSWNKRFSIPLRL